LFSSADSYSRGSPEWKHDKFAEVDVEPEAQEQAPVDE
jgi:hypothetical protein